MVRADSAASDSSCEDVLCVSDSTHLQKHRPMKEFDVLSGKYNFDRTVMNIDSIYE